VRSHAPYLVATVGGVMLLACGVVEAQSMPEAEPSPSPAAEAEAAAEAAAAAATNAAPTSLQTLTQTDPHFADMKIFSGRANVGLAREIAENLGVPLGAISIKCYADGEIGIQVNENVRGKDVYIIQPTCPPGVNDHLVELILMISTMRRASARKITAVIPYYGYARQDRKMASRVPISAADVARLLQAMGVDRVVAVDLHCGQIQGFFGPRTPCDNLEGHIVALPYFQQLGLKGSTTKVVSPDAGGVYRAKRFRDGLKKHGVDAGLAMIIKQRLQANQVGKMDLVGTVDGCDVIIVDDMIDTAGTLTLAAAELKARGAKRVFCFATHGLFSGSAHDRISKSTLEKVVVLNTVPLAATVSDKVIQLSCAGLLSEAIARIHTKKSVSALFDKVASD
jgi:ribose-phosphate pyrophosphokinase